MLHNIEDHIARTCDCGSVHFNLLKSSKIECANCHITFGYWNEMTTTVKIEAHCANDKEVLVTVAGNYDIDIESFKLQNGEVAERFVYDERNICVREINKERT